MIRPIISLICLILLMSSSAASSSSQSGSVPFIRHQFSSRSIGPLEAVEHYSIVVAKSPNIANGRHSASADRDHAWNHHWKNYHAMSVTDEENYLPLVDNPLHQKPQANAYHSMNNNHTMKNNRRRFRAEGSTWVEPFPASISVSFRVFGQDYQYPLLRLNRELFTANASLVIDEKNSYKHMRATYSAGHKEVGSFADDYYSWIVVTLQLDGRFTTVLSKNGTIIHVDRTSVLLNDIDQSHHFRIRDASINPHGMLAFISRNNTDFGICGVKGTLNESDSADPQMNPSSTTGAGPGRRLLMSRWTGCSPGDVQNYKRYFYIGIAMDVGYYNSVGESPASASNAISTLLALVNNVYYTQLNIFFQVGDTSIRTQPDKDEWNIFSDQYNPTVTVIYPSFRRWRKRRNNMGIWHLLTSGGDVPGIGCVACTCMTTGISISRKQNDQWIAMAHELGHNFGAQHPFARGGVASRGKYGGIMDYLSRTIRSDAKDPFANAGEYAFSSTPNSNSLTNKEEMCEHITASITGKPYDPAKSIDATKPSTLKDRLPTSKCWSTWSPFAIYWKYNSNLAITSNHLNQPTELYIGFGPDDGPDQTQMFEWVNGELLRSVADENLCLSVSPFEQDQHSGMDNTPIISITCSLTDVLQKWVRNGDQIVWKGTSKCIIIDGDPVIQAEHGLKLIVGSCVGIDAKQKFIFHEGNNPPTPSNNFYPPFEIQWKLDRKKIFSTSFLNDYPGVVLAQQPHFFQWINGEQLGDVSGDDHPLQTPNGCLTVVGQVIEVFFCDSTNYNQKWVKDGDLIRLMGTDQCMVLEDELLQIVVNIAKCDATDIHQQFILPSPPSFMIYWTENMDTVITAPVSGSISDLLSTVIGVRVPTMQKPHVVEGFNTWQLFQWYKGNLLRLTGSDLCLIAANNRIEMQDCSVGGYTQQFTVYDRQLRVSDKCVAVEGSILTLETCSPSSRVFVLPYHTTFTMEWKDHSLLLTFISGDKLTFEPFKGSPSGIPDSSQLFRWTSDNQIRLYISDQCLQVQDGKGSEGSRIASSPCNSVSTEQKFFKFDDFICWKAPSSLGSSLRCFSTIDGASKGGELILKILKLDKVKPEQQFIYREY